MAPSRRLIAIALFTLSSAAGGPSMWASGRVQLNCGDISRIVASLERQKLEAEKRLAGGSLESLLTELEKGKVVFVPVPVNEGPAGTRTQFVAADNLPAFVQALNAAGNLTVPPDEFMARIVAATATAVRQLRVQVDETKREIARIEQALLTQRDVLGACQSAASSPPPPRPNPEPPAATSPNNTGQPPVYHRGVWTLEEVRMIDFSHAGQPGVVGVASVSGGGTDLGGSAIVRLPGSIRLTGDLADGHCPDDQEQVQLTWTFSRSLGSIDPGEKISASVSAHPSAGSKCKGALASRTHIQIAPWARSPFSAEEGPQMEQGFSQAGGDPGRAWGATGSPSVSTMELQFRSGEPAGRKAVMHFVVEHPTGSTYFTYIYKFNGRPYVRPSSGRTIDR